MESKIILTPKTISREVVIAEGQTNTEERNYSLFANELGKRAPLETGLLPVGTLSYRQAGDHQQIVHQTAAGINRIIWGYHEGDRNAKQYLLAQPHRIVIGDFVSGELLGCRMFYSPIPVDNLDQPLYHVNTPNTNCKGYGDTAVGWQCLYHAESMSKMSIAQKTFRIVQRCSGAEAVNDANMMSTDGPRFYKGHQKPTYTWDPVAWEKKSDTEGFEWTLKEDLWIPVKVKSQDDQMCHTETGIPLTLRMAMEGNAACYYRDKYWPKPINAISRDDKSITSEDLYEKIISHSFTSTPAKAPAKKAAATKKAVATKKAPAPVKKAAVKKAASAPLK